MPNRGLFRPVTALLVACAMLLLGGIFSCKPAGHDVVVEPVQMPPLGSIQERGSEFTPISQKFKVAILTFVDQTGKASEQVDPLADMLTTELDKTRRFALFDRSDLKGAGATQTTTKKETDQEGTEIETTTTTGVGFDNKTARQKANVERKVDGVLLGYITSFEVESAPTDEEGNIIEETTLKGVLTVDYRIVNTAAARFVEKESNCVDANQIEQLRDLIVASGSGKVDFTMNADGTALQIDRTSMAKIAAQIEDDFTTTPPGDVEVKKVDGDKVTINIGEKHNIRPGFVGFIVRETDLGTFDYLALFLVLNTFPKATVAQVLSCGLEHVRIGSEVQLK